jgi:protein-tyrosine phosphatase
LFFFKKKNKTTLAGLIPQGYVDIHSHLLPGIDDGATDPANSLALVNTLRGYGFGKFITTPHVLTGVWNNTTDGIRAVEKTTQEFLKGEGITHPFKAAAEYLMDDVFLKRIKNEPLLTLKDNMVLVEMSYLNAPLQLYDILFDLHMEGYQAILAHPERYLFYHRNTQEYDKLKKAGCKFQLNLLSVTGYYGKHVAEIAEKLLNDGMIDYTGSDTHHERHTGAFLNTVILKDTAPFEKALRANDFFGV